MTIEAMKQALEALTGNFSNDEQMQQFHQKQMKAITSLRQAIEQAEKQEPYGWVFDRDVYDPTNSGPDFSYAAPKDGEDKEDWIPLYTTPLTAQREWVGLTREERVQIALTVNQYKLSQVDYSKAVYMAWEAKLKEKNT
jgi:hypothetical protein